MHSLLEEYLTEVAAYLGTLPEKRRSEELQEMRQHLAKLTDDGQAAGYTEEEAALAAIRHFGPPQTLGRQVARTWWRGRLVSAAAGPLGMTLLTGLLIPLPNMLVRLVMPPEIVSPGTAIIYGCPLPLAILWQMLIGLFIGRRLQRTPAVIVAVLLSASVLSFLLPFVQVTVEQLIATGSLPVYPNGLAVVQSYAQSALYNLPSSALFLLPAAFAGRAWSKRTTS